MQVASVLRDEVTTTDELIPSGETSSLPLQSPEAGGVLRPVPPDPDYVPRAKATQALEDAACRRYGAPGAAKRG